MNECAKIVIYYLITQRDKCFFGIFYQKFYNKLIINYLQSNNRRFLKFKSQAVH